jgi:methylglyoxal synthase
MVRRRHSPVTLGGMTDKVTPLPLDVVPTRPVVALVAHDRRKDEMVEWSTFNKGTLARCTIYATRTTGLTLESALDKPIKLLLSGPMGGDAQLGSLIAEGRIDAVFFFWDPLTPQPHDVDVKALLRLAVLYDVAIACNRSSADHIISSPLFTMPEKYREDRGPAYVLSAR